MYKKVLVVMLAIVMVFTMTPVVAFADGEMHTVTLKHVDENGFLMEEQPYFEIEVGINESLDAAMEANDYWYEEPVILGYNCNWVKGYFDFEKFGEDLLEMEQYYELRDGRVVYLNY